MRVSTRARYGLLAMIELGLRNKNGYTQLREIADSQGIPEEYLEQLMLPLSRSGLVYSKRGSKGGYQLAHPPANITLLEIVLELEGPLLPMEERAPNEINDTVDNTAAGEVWKSVRENIEETLGSMTLLQVCQRQRNKQAQLAPMYHI